MTALSDQYSDWDAAYVLGALAPEDRRDYERHLAECEACSRAVAELAGMPGLLAAVPAEQVLADEGQPPVGQEAGDAPRMPDTTLPRLLAAARRERSRSRGLLVGAIVLVAAVAAAGALVLAGWVGIPGAGPVSSPPSASEPASSPPRTPTSPPATTLVMAPVVPSPLSAELTLQAQPWGTRIASRCSYADAYTASGARPYALYLTDRNGETSLLATWLAGPGTTVTPVGTTSVTEADIATVDIRSVTSGQVLLRSRLAP